jgi:hypothetical protein
VDKGNASGHMVALRTWCVHDAVRVAERDKYAPPRVISEGSCLIWFGIVETLVTCNRDISASKDCRKCMKVSISSCGVTQPSFGVSISCLALAACVVNYAQGS